VVILVNGMGKSENVLELTAVVVLSGSVSLAIRFGRKLPVKKKWLAFLRGESQATKCAGQTRYI
jgi:hypothetical protein